MQEMQVQSLVDKIPWSRKWQPIPVLLFLTLLHCSIHSIDRGTWQATVHGDAKSKTCLGTHTVYFIDFFFSSLLWFWCLCEKRWAQGNSNPPLVSNPQLYDFYLVLVKYFLSLIEVLIVFILFLSSISIFMTITLNSLSGKIPTSISLKFHSKILFSFFIHSISLSSYW